jgi:RNA methyltransferase, TrmH family
MKYIYSKKNEVIRKIRYLNTKKGREELSLFVVEGEKLVHEALEYADVDSVIFSENYLGNKEIFHEAYILKDDVYRYIQDTVSSQGILAVVKKKGDIPFFDSKLEVLCEDVQDPGNLGTIIRTSESFGVDIVEITSGCADPYNPKTVRSTMGSILRIPVKKITDIKAFILMKKELGYTIICGCLDGMDISELKHEIGKSVLIVGNESRGITEEVVALCDIAAKIPIYGRNESLNVSVATGIILYEIRKRLPVV